jgi:hypothetical protein
VLAAVLRHHSHRAFPTSGEYRLEVFFVMAPPSQAVEPPANPARFTPKVAGQIETPRPPEPPSCGGHAPTAKRSE